MAECLAGCDVVVQYRVQNRKLASHRSSTGGKRTGGRIGGAQGRALGRFRLAARRRGEAIGSGSKGRRAAAMAPVKSPRTVWRAVARVGISVSGLRWSAWRVPWRPAQSAGAAFGRGGGMRPASAVRARWHARLKSAATAAIPASAVWARRSHARGRFIRNPALF
jgi:hypothetical protein